MMTIHIPVMLCNTGGGSQPPQKSEFPKHRHNQSKSKTFFSVAPKMENLAHVNTSHMDNLSKHHKVGP